MVTQRPANPLPIIWVSLFALFLAGPACLAQTTSSTTGVGAEISGPLQSNLTNATVLGFIPDTLADYVVLVRLLMTGAPNTTPTPSSGSEPLALHWILLITAGGVLFVTLLGLVIYNTVVARQMEDMAKTAHPAGGAYVKVIQVELGHP